MASKTVEKLKENLTCSMCMEVFTDPVMLPCMHTFCKRCLGTLVETHKSSGSSNFPCPDCRKVLTITGKGAEGFKKHFLVNSILDVVGCILEGKAGDTFCDNCKDFEKIDAVSQCIECKRRLCRHCTRSHKTIPSLRHHKVIDLTGNEIQDAQNALQLLSKRTMHCQLHSEQPLKYFCTVDKTMICQDCYIIDHAGHKCEDLATVASRHLPTVDKFIKLSSNRAAQLDEAIAKREDFKSKVIKDADTKKSKCDEERNYFHSQVDKHYNDLYTNIEQMYTSQTKMIDSQLDELKLKKASTSTNVSILMSHGHPTEILHMIPEISQKLTELSMPFEQVQSLGLSFELPDINILEGRITQVQIKDNQREIEQRKSIILGDVDFQNKIAKLPLTEGNDQNDIDDDIDDDNEDDVYYDCSDDSEDCDECDDDKVAISPRNLSHEQEPMQATSVPSPGNVKDVKTDAMPTGIINMIQIDRDKRITDIVTLKNDDIVAIVHDPLTKTNDTLILTKNLDIKMTISKLNSRRLGRTNDDQIALTCPDGNWCRVQMCNGEGKCMKSIRVQIAFPSQPIFNSRNEMVLAENKLDKKILKWINLKTGTVVYETKRGLLENFDYLSTVDEDGVLASDYKADCVKIINNKSNAVRFTYGSSGTGEGQLRGPLGVIKDDNGRILVADRLNSRVHLVGKDGRFMHYVITKLDGLGYPRCLALNNQGHLIVGDERGRIFVVNYE